MQDSVYTHICICSLHLQYVADYPQVTKNLGKMLKVQMMVI